MAGITTMTPLHDWLSANGIPVSTFWHLRKRKPDQVPETIRIGRRHFITPETEAEFRERRLKASRAERAAIDSDATEAD